VRGGMRERMGVRERLNPNPNPSPHLLSPFPRLLSLHYLSHLLLDVHHDFLTRTLTLTLTLLLDVHHDFLPQLYHTLFHRLYHHLTLIFILSKLLLQKNGIHVEGTIDR
jgi:hypothetical protein